MPSPLSRLAGPKEGTVSLQGHEPVQGQALPPLCGPCLSGAAGSELRICWDFVRASEGGGVFGGGRPACPRCQRHPLVVMAQLNVIPKTQHLPILQPDQLELGDDLGHTGDHGAAARRPEQGLWPPDKQVGLGEGRGGRRWPMGRRPREALCLVPSYLSLSPCRFPLGETKPRALPGRPGDLPAGPPVPGAGHGGPAN